MWLPFIFSLIIVIAMFPIVLIHIISKYSWGRKLKLYRNRQTAYVVVSLALIISITGFFVYL
ncbi:MAG: hypothetical protein RR651_04870 [Lysinibacillus sp.]